MRVPVVLASLIFCVPPYVSFPATAQVLNGVVIKNETGGSTAEGVLVTAPGANQNVTRPDGQFRFDFRDKKAGDIVQVSASKDGYVVVNWIQLKVTLPSDPNGEPLVLLICKETEREEWARRYYRLKSLDAVEEVYKRRIRQLEESNLKTTAAMAELLRERNQAEAEAEKTSDAVAHLQPGETADVYAQAMALFLKGDIQEAREVLKQWTEASANLLTLLDTPPEPSNVALSNLVRGLQRSRDAAATSKRLFETLDPRLIDPDHMFYATYAFYLATNDARWKEQVFVHLFAFVRQVLDVHESGPTVSAYDLKNFLKTKWTTPDQMEFFGRCLDIVEQSRGHDEKSQRLLNLLINNRQLVDAIKNDKPIVSRIVRLCHKTPAEVLVKVAPEAFLVFIASQIVGLDQTDDDLPDWDRRLQAAVDHPPAFERSDFALKMKMVVEADSAARSLEFPVVVGDVSVEGYSETDVIHVSAVKKWWNTHQKEVKYWNSF